MTDRISATFEVTSWDEQPIDDSDGAKVTEAVVEKTYSGDIDGTSVTRWLMAYRPDESATFLGVERITGTVGGAEGSLALTHSGAFEDGAAKAELSVHSGTGALAGASGSGSFLADPSGSITLDLETT